FHVPTDRSACNRTPSSGCGCVGCSLHFLGDEGWGSRDEGASRRCVRSLVSVCPCPVSFVFVTVCRVRRSQREAPSPLTPRPSTLLLVGVGAMFPRPSSPAPRP